METGSTDCISFEIKENSPLLFIVRNETLYLCVYSAGTAAPVSVAWNRPYNCSVSNSIFKLCITDVQFPDSGLFSLKLGDKLVQNITLQIEGKMVFLAYLGQRLL